MNSQINLCSGCFRTLDEITNWLKYTEQQRAYITTMVEYRRKLLLEGELLCLTKKDSITDDC
jgi:predicted Fe-S protein YdhL (DUF1289 family)